MVTELNEKNSFNAIKIAVTSLVCLALIDFTDEHNGLFFFTDASKIALSGTLVVRNLDGL